MSKNVKKFLIVCVFGILLFLAATSEITDVGMSSTQRIMAIVFLALVAVAAYKYIPSFKDTADSVKDGAKEVKERIKKNKS